MAKEKTASRKPNTKMPKAVIFYGPPGSGKGTQAALFLKKIGSGYSHFDTGSFIEKKINDPVALKSPLIARQRKLFMSGKLCDSSWVISIIDDPIRDFSKEGQGLIFSGSPRTSSEAFGGRGKKGTVLLLEQYYGRENIIVFWFDIPVAESVKRNSLRGRPGLDEPATIRIRCREYKKMTLPIVKKMRERGIKIVKVNALPKPSQIAAEVMKKFKEFERFSSKR